MKSALVVWGGWDGHEPKQCVDIFIPFLRKQGFEVEVADTMDVYLDADRMKQLNLVVPCWTMGEITREQSRGLLGAIRSGVGIAGWHGGMCDSFRENTEYQFMTGGQWVAHPGGIVRYKVKITKPGDPIVKDIGDFYVRSEQYYMHTDPGNDVLATTTFSGRHDNIPWIKGTIMPVIWKRRYGKARVFYSSLGHTAEEFSHPPIFKIMKRGILWAIGDSPSAV